MRVAANSNRALLELGNALPDIDSAFDANGNLLYLQPGQTLNWDARNQLQRVAQVAREDTHDDDEVYVYDASGQRVRKVRTRQGGNIVHLEETLYLPGLEVRVKERQVRDSAVSETKSTVQEELHVITTSAGGQQVRLLHWHTGRPTAMESDQLRYSVSDQLGSSTLELGKDGALLSHESYYPFGGTAWWAAKNTLEGGYKWVRYSGKERDATGLYYYGLRYYAPWLQRWINPDPAGDVDGFNRFAMVGNNPINRVDSDGSSWRQMNGIRMVSRALNVVVNAALGALAGALAGYVTGGGAYSGAVLLAIAGATVGVFQSGSSALQEYRDIQALNADTAYRATYDSRISDMILGLAASKGLNEKETNTLLNFTYRQSVKPVNEGGIGIGVFSVFRSGQVFGRVGPMATSDAAALVMGRTESPNKELRRLKHSTVLLRDPKLSLPSPTTETVPSIDTHTASAQTRVTSNPTVRSLRPEITAGISATEPNQIDRDVNVVTLGALDIQAYGANEVRSINLTLEHIRQGRTRGVDMHKHKVGTYKGLYSADLYSFGGQTGRGANRLFLSKQGNVYTARAIGNPH